jgi:protein-glutamine gamma-glutamyltransferase
MTFPSPLLYSLIACIFLVSAPHAEHLPWWVIGLCAGLLGWRAYLAYRRLALPPRWLLFGITLACTAGILLTFRTVFGREVGVTLLILLACLKLLELRAARDAAVLIYLSCFIIITNFFYSQSIPTALFMLFTLLVITTTWVQLQTRSLLLKPRLRIAALLLAQAIPLTLLLFVLFPRVQGPLWGMPQDAYSSSGLDDKMSPGSVSKLSLSDAVAFRVTFNGTVPRRDQLYWRGPVLWDFDGSTWQRGISGRYKPAQLDNLSQPSDYTVTLEPHNKTWLFLLDMPTQLSTPAQMGYDFQVHAPNPINARLRYTAQSQLVYRANAEEAEHQLERAITLPRTHNPRARQLAQEWRKTARSDEDLARNALQYFAREKFEYTLEPPPLGVNGIDDFLFSTRKGFCEHYASSFVFLMRAAGVPARVVTGYQGGELNQLGGYYIVRQSDAHAWAEIWLKERGWVRIDPTAASVPERVQRGVSNSVSNPSALPFLSRNPPAWLRDLRLNLDAMTNQWNQWVLGYNPERQFALLSRLGMESVTWQNMAINLMLGVAFLVGIFALLLLRKLYRRDTDAVQKLYLDFCRKLAKAGVPRAANEGAQDYALRAAQHLPQHATHIAHISAQYIALRYQADAAPDALQALRRAVHAFKL